MLTIQELEVELGVSTRSVRYYLNEWKQLNLVPDRKVKGRSVVEPGPAFNRLCRESNPDRQKRDFEMARVITSEEEPHWPLCLSMPQSNANAICIRLKPCAPTLLGRHCALSIDRGWQGMNSQGVQSVQMCAIDDLHTFAATTAGVLNKYASKTTILEVPPKLERRLERRHRATPYRPHSNSYGRPVPTACKFRDSNIRKRAL